MRRWWIILLLLIAAPVGAQLGAPAVRSLEHPMQVAGTAWSPDGTWLAVWGDSTIYVWDWSAEIEPLILEQPIPVEQALWSPDSKHLLILYAIEERDNTTAQVWSIESGETLTLNHDLRIMGAAWNGARILTWSDDATARIWSLDDPDNPIILRQSPDNPWHRPLLRAIWNDQHVIAFGYGDDYISETVLIWDLSDLSLTTVQHDLWLNGMMLSGDGLRLLTWAGDQTMRLWTLDGSAEPVVFQHSEQVVYVGWDGFSNTILSIDLNNNLWMWDVNDSEHPTRLNHPGGAGGVITEHSRFATYATWSSNYTDVREVRIWGMTALYYVEPIVLTHPAPFVTIQWNPQAPMLLTATKDGMVRVFYRLVEERKEAFFWQLPETLQGAGWHPDGVHFLAWYEQTVGIWQFSES